MSDIIQLLPDHVANQIAAGEVVQRPASVVKELLENAIDAKATQIKLLIKESGKTLVQVIDNGIGMSVSDARLSFERHATSKISAAEDLFQLNTKGFRGEALASIAAIAHVELKTKREDDELGTLIKIEGSQVTAQEQVVTPTGTSIAVKNLFFNIPARRNFLKSDHVELRHVMDEFQRVAFVHPEISFSMYHNGSDTYNLPSSNFRQRIVGIMGKKSNEKLVPVNEDTEIVKITGYIVKPEFAKKSRGEQFLFVNNRFIKSSYLNHAITVAFEGLLQPKTHPGYFLHLEVAPESIDINIHPTKTEVKFDNEHDLYAIIRSAVKHSLGQFQIVPVLDFKQDPTLQTPYSYQKKKATTPMIQVDRSFNPFEEEQANKTSFSSSSKAFKRPSTGSWENLYVGLESSDSSPEVNEDPQVLSFESESSTGTFFNEKDITIEQITLQIQNKYIVSKIKSGVMVIHQGRAHQRILFEEFQNQLKTNNAVTQQLLFEEKIQVSVSEMLLVNRVKPILEGIGFVFSTSEEDAISLVGVPASIANENLMAVMNDLIENLSQEETLQEEYFVGIVAKSLAKSLAVKSGKRLTAIEQEDIVNRLFACSEPAFTSDNKKIFTTYTTGDFDKKLF